MKRIHIINKPLKVSDLDFDYLDEEISQYGRPKSERTHAKHGRRHRHPAKSHHH